MESNSGLTTAQVLDVFAEEVSACGGRVADTFNDGLRLFSRSVIPLFDDVRTGDRVQGGVALKMTKEQAWLYPYVFRLVCRNGAITAQALESRLLAGFDLEEPEASLQTIREGVVACCTEDVFIDNVRRMRSACEKEADLALNLLPLISQFRAGGHDRLFSQIMDRFFKDGDKSPFGMANALTAIARDTQDPELRWDLEEFGGAVATNRVPQRPANGGKAAVDESKRAVLVG
jgi:hypothetical protein